LKIEGCPVTLIFRGLVLWLALVAGLGASVASAQMMQAIVADTHHSAGGGSYTGPGDVVASAAMWWGLRAYSAADRGTAVANVCLNDGTTCGDVLSDATTGFPPNAPVISGTTCNNSTQLCQIKKVYSKGTAGSGADLPQGTAAERPIWWPSALGSHACAKFDGSSRLLKKSVVFASPA
jgi:hypothetical protein